MLEELTSGESIETLRKALNTTQEGKRLVRNYDAFQNIRPGSSVWFGIYAKTGFYTNGLDDIEWIVLEVRNGKALLLSRYALDCRAFDENGQTTMWNNCTVRSWLNDEFIKRAFSDAEKTKIITTMVSGSNYATQDKVFLLDSKEAKMYFASAPARQCSPTKYTAERGWLGSSEYCDWMLRSPALSKGTIDTVAESGFINEYGLSVGYKRAVRPAMWIDLNA